MLDGEINKNNSNKPPQIAVFAEKIYKRCSIALKLPHLFCDTIDAFRKTQSSLSPSLSTSSDEMTSLANENE